MSSTHLTVSVIIPTYNRANLVCEAVDSLLSQTLVPDEIIVVNDGSTDNTQEVLQAYQNPVRVIWRENGGQPAARNTGLEHATGDLIAFLDDDDTLTPHSIEIRATFLEQDSSFDVVYGDIRITDLDGNDKGLFSARTHISGTSGDVFAAFVETNLRPIHAFMFRRASIRENNLFKAAFRGVEDYDFWLHMAMHCRFHYIDEVMGNYRFHPEQMTSLQRRRMSEAEIEVREKLFETPAFAALPSIQRARAYSIQGTRHMLLGNTYNSRNYYRQAIITAPQMPRPYFLYTLTFLGHKGFDQVLQFIRRWWHH